MRIDLPSPPKRILLIKPSAIGDVVHTLPILNLLRKRWPEAHIAWLLTPACAGLLEGHPLLSEVIQFDRKRFGRGWRSPAALVGFMRFTRSLREREFDLVIDLQGLLRSGYLSHKTRAPVCVGFKNARELAPLFYTHAVPIHTDEQHAIDRYLKVAAALGCDPSIVEFPFHVTGDDRAAVDTMLGNIGDFAVVLPGTNWPTKRWPIERFAELAAPLRDRYRLATVVAGGPGDRELASRIAGLNLAGKTSLRQLVALFQRAKIIIGNDSGPTHIAAALGKPLVAIYGPTNPVRTGPYLREDAVLRIDIPCSPCYSRTCSHHSCLQWLGMEAVMDLARQQLAR